MINNEIYIFFIIIILIGLSYYDLKYSIIFCIILYFIYLYFNKLTYESNYDEYKYYDDEIKDILDKITNYRKYDEQNYKLGLKYHYHVLKNIKLLNNVNEKIIFNLILDKINVYIDKTITQFNSIIFSIDSNKDSEEFTNIINILNIKYKDLINQMIISYNNNNELDCDNIYCSKDLILNLFTDNEKKINIEKPITTHNMFDRGEYIGINKGNEVDYTNKENISFRSIVMNRYTSDITPDEIYKKVEDKNNSNWSKINRNRIKDQTKNRFNKLEDDVKRYFNTDNIDSKNRLYDDGYNQIKDGSVDIFNYLLNS